MSAHPGPIRHLHDRRRAEGDDCLSDLALDRLAIGELEEPDRARAAAHLGGCTRCRAAEAALTADRQIFAAEADVPHLAADAIARARAAPGPARRAWWRLLAPLALVGGAAVALVAAPRGLPEVSSAAGVRAKGALALSALVVHAERGTAAASLHEGEPLHPGDRVQLRLSSPADGAGYVVVVGVEASGRTSVYFPAGATAAALPAGRDVPLPHAIELDDTLGREQIVALRCPRPIAVADVLGERGAPSDAGCARVSYTIEKIAR